MSGLAGTVVLQNNGGDNLSRSVNGVFTFAITLANGSAYNVTVLTQPAGQTCSVANGSGNVMGANVTNVQVNCVTNPAPTFTIGGTITGLTGTVVLQNNGGDNLSRSANGAFTFATALANNTGYNVTVLTQPAGQNCTVTNGAGVVSGANVANVQVDCVTNPGPTFTVGGTISGLTGTVVLQNNGGDNLSRSANGTFTFAAALADGSAYDVTVLTQPAGQTCTVASGSGNVNGANVTSVQVTCVTNPPPTFTIGGTISGLAGTVVLQNNGGDNLTRTVNGAFSFPTALASGAAYNVTVLTQPAGQTCTVSNGSGNVGGANVTNVAVSCTNNPVPTFTIGGTIAGLTGTVILQNNGGDDLTRSVNGAFTFAGALPDGAPYNVTVLSHPAGQVCTVGNGAGNVGSANVTNVQVNCATAVQPITLAVTIGPDRVRPGEGAVSHLHVANRGAATVNDIVLQARFPSAGVNNALDQALITGGGTCPGGFCDRNELVSWNIGTLAAGEGTTVSLPMVVTLGTADGTVITVAAEVFVGATQVALASASTTVDGDNALSLALAEDKDTVAPGAALTYTLTYGNRATHSITGTTLSLPLPPGVAFVSATGGGNLAGNTVQWNLGTLQQSESGRQQVVVTVSGALGNGSLIALDGAQVAGTSAITGAELARVSTVTRVRTSPVLGLAIEMDPDPVRQNEGVRAKLTVTNLGGATTAGTRLQVRFPTDRVNHALNQTLITGGGTCPGGFCDRYELVTWNLGLLAAGEGVTVMLPMQVTGGTPSGTLITLDAFVLADGVSPTAASRTIVVDNDNALSLALEEDKDAVTPGGTLNYTLTYANGSAASITGTTLSLPLPAGVAFVSATGGGTLSGNTVQWNLATLQASESGRRQVVVTVNGGLANGTQLAVDAAQIAGTSATTGPEFARASAVTRVLAAPVLGLAIEMDPDPVRQNEGVRAKLTVTNLGGATVFGTQLQVRFPTDRVNHALNQTLITGGGTCPGGFCDRYELVTWNLGAIAAGAGVTVMLPMQVTGDTPSGTLITLDASALADGVSATSASRTIVVDNDNALSLALEDDRDAVAPGGTLTYTLTYGNRATHSITGTTLSLPLPPGVAFVSATGGGTLSGNSVSWNLGTVAASSSGRVQAVVTAGAALANGTILAVNAAQIGGTSATTGPEFARATAATRVRAGSPLRLAVGVAPSPISPNQTQTATLTVTNTGGSGLLGVVLQARYPTDRINNALNQSLLTGGGTCPGGFCDRYELVTWNIGALAAGAALTVTMPMVVTPGTPSGTLITVDAEVKSDAADQANAGDTGRVQN